MFSLPKSTPEPGPLDRAIEAHVSKLNNHDIHTEEYAAAVAALKVLCDAKASLPRPNIVSADTAVVVAGNLIGIVAILGYERAHVVTSKALNFVMKAKA